jgi:hypothetical protein
MESSDGSATLRFDTGGAGRVTPTDAQIAAHRWLVRNESAVARAVLNAIFAEYPRLREEYIDAYDAEDAQAAARASPPLERAEQLNGQIGLSGVFVLPVAKNGVSYVGFEFGCVWESEHGLGVLTHKNRVVETGSAYSAFDGRRAEADASGG